MPKKRNDRHGDIPLPRGWEAIPFSPGKVFYMDHNTKQTTWLDPRDRYKIEIQSHNIMIMI